MFQLYRTSYIILAFNEIKNNDILLNFSISTNHYRTEIFAKFKNLGLNRKLKFNTHSSRISEENGGVHRI